MESRRAMQSRAPPFSSVMMTLTPAPLPLPLSSSSSPVKPTFSVPLKRLTPEELVAHREQELCFNCDKRYHHNHRCNSRVHLLIADDEERSPDTYTPLGLKLDPPDPIDPNTTQLNLHSLTGPLAPKTLRFSGLLDNQKVLTLVDGGSTHNFIQDTMVAHLGLSPCDTSPLKVMAGNGQYLHCHQVCPAMSIMIQEVAFTIDLHLLPLCGANIVLGVQWLRSLGPILTDYTTLSMTFMHQGRTVEFKGEDTSTLQPFSPQPSLTSSSHRYCQCLLSPLHHTIRHPFFQSTHNNLPTRNPFIID